MPSSTFNLPLTVTPPLILVKLPSPPTYSNAPALLSTYPLTASEVTGRLFPSSTLSVTCVLISKEAGSLPS